ncbi:recombinase family protein [Salmonella enterica]|nr:recombinase family protein [Salmonella enterica subsp. enterica]EHW9181785.1 recombinase family protein [Salmonella enterica subsp. enterica]EIX6431186.1 recombinase family protein [Salmonella enterica]
MLIGYVRVSTIDQCTDLQRTALKLAGCLLIFEDKASGKNSRRPGLHAALEMLMPGDVLMVWKLDRLGRSIRDLISLVAEIQEIGCHFQSVTDSINTSTPSGRFFFHVMGALAEMERELIVERTRAGLAAAREKGRHPGRPRRISAQEWARAEMMLEAGISRRSVAKEIGVVEKTIYKKFPKYPRHGRTY